MPAAPRFHDGHAPLIIDIAGLQLEAIDRERLAHPLVGGLILFGRNWRDREQLSLLCASVKSVRSDLLILVDHEGGRVQRFRTDGFTHLPSMAQLGVLWNGRPGDDPRVGAMRAQEAATACGLVVASELRACGVDMSFTPVLDLDWARSAVIGDRALHADSAVVSVLARALLHGLALAGMAGCGKHFPGHGHVRADSHTAIPVDRRSLDEILGTDARPYGWLGPTLASVMPAHVVYSAVDSRPAGFSHVWLQDILRGQLGFLGAIFSDDLSMAGARRIDGREVSHTEAALAALHAGCDLVLLCNQSPGGGRAVDALIDGLSQARASGLWREDPLGAERRLGLLPRGPALGWDDLMVDPRYMQALERMP